MDTRIGNIIISNAGGTAGKDSKTYKAALPSSWIAELGINESSRQIELQFDGEQIIIRKALSFDDFIKSKKTLGHDVRSIRYYNRNILCTVICADFTDKTLRAENHTDNLIKTAFGKNAHPNWSDFIEFLEERCISKNRDGLREYLDSLGLDEYDPIEIIKKTSGRMAEDEQWLEIEVVK